jgi:hypothetical protein
MPILLADSRRTGIDTVPILERAAGQRSTEADTLRKAGHGLAAIYLYGYSAEMRVKAAYFRFDLRQQDLDPQTVLDHPRRSSAVGQFEMLGLPKRPGAHDILGWAQLLVAKRASLSMRYESALEREVVNQARVISDRWNETLRYRLNTPYGHEVRLVHETAVWFGSNYHRL